MTALGPGSISGVVVARHEEAVIDRCLQSLDGVVDEIVFVHDGPCEDRTTAIAERHGARVFVRPATGNPEAHTVFAYEQARGEWLLNVDADEFLSDELRAAVPELVRRSDVNGFEFVWPMWDGQRYVTTDGPYKLALHRRSATHLLGMLQSRERIDGVTERVPLRLEHRPLYNNFTFATMRTKWRRWATVHAAELTEPFAALPKFNWDGPERWPWWRAVLNWSAPVILVPYLGALFVRFVQMSLDQLPLRQNLRFSFFNTCYAALVQVEVIKRLYGGLVRR